MLNVVLFKSESDGPDKFVKLLEEQNFEVQTIFCLSFQYKNLQQLAEKLKQPDDYAGIIFTSQRAVQAVHEAAKSQPEVLLEWKSKKNFSVGESTSELAKSQLDLETKGKETGNAQNLAAFIITEVGEENSKKFLFPSGNLKQDILEKSLKEKEIEVECLEAYETIQHPDLDGSVERLKNEKIDFIVYFSPSGVKFSLSVLSKHEILLENIKIIAIGPSTMKALEENDLKSFRTCAKPTPESLVEALTS